MRTPQTAMREAMESGAFDAWMMGNKVQVRTDDTQWNYTPHPKFQDPRFHFRPMPTPTLRPWRPEEVPVGAQVRYATNPKSCRMLITSNIDPHLLGEVKRWTYMDLFKSMEHSTDGGKTWNPCGVLEGGE